MEEVGLILRDIDYDDEISEINLQRKRNSPYEYTSEEYCCFYCSKCKKLINIY